jgi:hypothetical protein
MDSVPQKTTTWDDIFEKYNDDSIIIEPIVDIERDTTYSIAPTEPPKLIDELTISYTKSIECTKCKTKISLTEEISQACTGCGLLISDTSSYTDEKYSTSDTSFSNVNDKGFMSMRVVGKGAYGQNRALLKSSADYGRYRHATTLKDMNKWNVNGKFVPKAVMEEANNMFSKIKQHNYVYRKDVKKGVITACVYYACHMHKISRTPAEIANWAQIAEKFHSMGDRILRDLNERGVIELPSRINPIEDYIERYLKILNIDAKKYKQFILDIIEVATNSKLHVLSDSKNNTKCIGTIYLLIERVRDLRQEIDREKLDKECDISKTTFIKYYKLICKYYRKFIPVFVKHDIPMKAKWKEDIAKVIEDHKKIM